MLKIRKLINIVIKNIRYYSLNMLFYKVILKICTNRKLKSFFSERYKYYLEKGICKKYSFIIKKYENKNVKCNFKRNEKIIWVFWWQGIENAPEIVKKCVMSLKINNKDYKLNIISKANFDKYISLNDYIIKKFDSGKIGLAHFSDILRVNLLLKYGGIWADATIFLTKGFEDDILNYDFYSIKSYKENTDNVSEYRWTTYFLCAKPDNELLNFLKDLFNAYYKDNDYVIDYFMTDYFIDIAYNNIKYIKKMIDSIPINNTHSEELIKVINNKYDEKYFKKITMDTYINKLNYKVGLLKDENTFYNCILKR